MSESLWNEGELPFRYCPGCTHGNVLKSIVAAIGDLAPKREQVVAVTDIGCVGLADRYLGFSTFHGLHGRSIAYAMGLKLARPELSVVTLIGDGGVGIGAGHLVAAARRNVGICVVVFNNFNFGMTGGQQSSTTFTGGCTSTTPDGSPERPLDIAALAKASGATFVARMSGLDKELPEMIRRGLAHPGFALIDVWEICTAHYMKANDFHRRDLEEELSRVERGLIHEERRPEMAAQVHARIAPRASADPLGRFRSEAGPPPAAGGRVGITIAGSAGQKIRYAASLLARAAIGAGLHAAQSDEFPITVLTGFSLADVILDREPVDHLECETPDVLLALTADGAARFRARGRTARRVYRLPDVPPVGGDDVVLPAPPGVRREHLALWGIGRMLEREPLVPAEALAQAIRRYGFRGEGGRELETQLRLVAAP